MIELRIMGDTASEFGAQLAAVAQLMSGTAPAAAAAEPAKTGRGRGKAATPTAGDPGNDPASAGAVGNSENAPAGAGATTQPATASDASATSTITRETVQPKATAYGQKGGVAALKELFTKHGSAAGNWSGVPDANLAALNTELDELLAA